MNKEQIVSLMRDGAQLSVKTSEFRHRSFSKGFRKLRSSNVSFAAALKVLSSECQYKDGIYSVEATGAVA
jgi:hypothetical protein